VSELPKGWATANLGSISDYVTSGSRDWSKFYSTAGALFVRTQDINTNRLTTIENIARVHLPEKIEGKRTLIRLGDLLITITGANVGKCARISDPIPEAYVSQSVALVRLLVPSMGPFIHLQLIAPGEESDKTLLQQSAYGMGRPVLSLPNVRDVPLKIAPTEEQKRIIEKLSAVLGKVEACRVRLDRVPQILKKFREAVLEAAVSGRLTEKWRAEQPSQAAIRAYPTAERPDSAGVLPDSWNWHAIGDLSVKVSDGVHKKPEYLPAGVPFITVKDLTAGPGIDFSNTRFISLADHDEFIRRTHPEKGDLLVSKDGTLGVIRLVDTDRPFSIFVSVALIKLKDKSMAEYMKIALEAPVVQKQMVGVGSGLQHIHLQDLRKDVVPLPPPAEQKEIVRRVAQLFGLANNLSRRYQDVVAGVELLTPSVLAKAFRGELVPQDPNDESAEDMLERIRKASEPQVAIPRHAPRKVSAKRKAE
jgi:type I restriction enzyme, S subunit